MGRRIWLPITLLVLASLGCSLFGRAGEAIEVGQEAATRVAEVATTVGEEGVGTLVPEPLEGEAEGDAEGQAEDETAEEAPPPPELDSDALEGLDSYRTRFSTEWNPENGEPETFSFEEARTREPSARRLTMDGMTEDESVEIVQIEDKSWMCSGGTCTQMDADPEELASGLSDAAMFDPAGTLHEADATFVGRERVNGVQTRHYRLNLTAMQAAFLSRGEVSDLEGHTWIADEPDLPALAVRFEMSWTEERDDVTGQTSFIYETYDINEPFTIEPPEGAESSGLPDDVPPYPNGEQTFSMEGMTSFDSPDSITAVAAFYHEELAAAGWTLQSDDEMDTLAQQVWTKGDRTLTVLASEDDGSSSVMISIEDGS